MPLANTPATAPSSGSLATIAAMARMARQTTSVVHVVVPREPGTVEIARTVARVAGVEVEVDLLPRTIRARFDGRPAPR